jgi:D-glycero-D-manno-heptose 1,7-bisphosphate phosphatase
MSGVAHDALYRSEGTICERVASDAAKYTMMSSAKSQSQPAVFLDRDGVLIEDVDLLVDEDEAHLLAGVPEALTTLNAAGFTLVVVTNQPVIARGLATEDEVQHIHQHLEHRLAAKGAGIDAWYYCPHHPHATLPEYRVDCDCRKPGCGMLLTASRERDIDLARSYLVGDRVTDIAAGAAAGCRTVLVKSGKHEAPPIQTARAFDRTVKADHECASLLEASHWIMQQGVEAQRAA